MNVRAVSCASPRSRLSPRRALSSLAAASLFVLLVSCSGGPMEEATDALSERCDVEDLAVPVEEIPEDEGVDGFILGDGSQGVIFLNQTDTDLCDWLPFAREMVGEDRKALIYDYSLETSDAEELERAATFLADSGVDRVVLVGASKGAVVALESAPVVDSPEVAGVASLSAVAAFDGMEPRKAAKDLRTPLLLLASREDDDTVEVARDVGETAPSEDARVEVFPEYDHGVALLTGDDGERAGTLLEEFVDRNLSRS